MDHDILAAWVHLGQHLAESALLFLFFLMVISRSSLTALRLLNSLRVIRGPCPFLPRRRQHWPLGTRTFSRITVMPECANVPMSLCVPGQCFTATASRPPRLQPGLGIFAVMVPHEASWVWNVPGLSLPFIAPAFCTGAESVACPSALVRLRGFTRVYTFWEVQGFRDEGLFHY